MVRSSYRPSIFDSFGSGWVGLAQIATKVEMKLESLKEEVENMH